MELFYVERVGVYSQGIFGIYSTLELAQAALVRAKALEKDNYHSFVILRVELDKDSELNSDYSDGQPQYQEKLVEVHSFR